MGIHFCKFDSVLCYCKLLFFRRCETLGTCGFGVGLVGVFLVGSGDGGDG